MGQLTNNFWQTTTPVIAIEKAVGYLPIPGIGSVSFPTGGVPFCVQQFIYQCPNNFCIPSIPPIDTVGQWFNMAIRYNDPVTGVPVRYKLWSTADSAAQDIPAPLYTGQPIHGQNFAIEIWSQSDLNVVDIPFGLLLATSVQQALTCLNGPSTFQLGTVAACASVYSTNGLNMPLQFLPCATAQYTGQQTGTLVSITGQVSLPSIPVVGANYRFNQTTGTLEILNLTTGKYNPLNTQGQNTQEQIVIEPQD